MPISKIFFEIKLDIDINSTDIAIKLGIFGNLPPEISAIVSKIEPRLGYKLFQSSIAKSKIKKKALIS